ncbi:protein-glutamate O-methyltransferase CheR [Bacillaceae bacterium IKA-2]|jgi:chemotaxis protein methyltransferase CheR|nr:protein-glutamate O-methyltransferase CheR [Bacillaceae bacterium IKA-2]
MTDRTLTLSNEEFQLLRQFVLRSIGVNLTEAKRSLVVSRLSKQVRKLGFSSFSEYLKLVKEDKQEKENMFNMITTNVTKFFREQHHFEYITKDFLPQFAASQDKVVRIWTSACSSGEEPYSIAMSLEKALKSYRNLNYKLLASDINTEMLQKAKLGIYRREEVEGVPYDELKSFFKMGQGDNEGLLKVKESLQKKIVFQRINLVSDQQYPIKEKVHIIFCRNVFIYFSKDTQMQILKRFHEHLHQGGILILGHSESIPLSQGGWRLIQKTIYEKTD